MAIAAATLDGRVPEDDLDLVQEYVDLLVVSLLLQLMMRDSRSLTYRTTHLVSQLRSSRV